jgi:hypothetical protein
MQVSPRVSVKGGTVNLLPTLQGCHLDHKLVPAVLRRVLFLRLHDDLQADVAAGLGDAAAGADNILLGSGGLDIEGHTTCQGIADGDGGQKLLAQLQPV